LHRKAESRWNEEERQTERGERVDNRRLPESSVQGGSDDDE